MTDQTNIKESLAKVGIVINDIYDLVNTSKSYSVAIPILLDFLKTGISDDITKEGVIRALAVKEAKGKAGEILIKEYYKIPKEKINLRWVIGNTMEIIATEADIQDMLQIVTNKENGISRQMFVLALGKFKSKQVEDVLIDLLDDDDLILHALDALGKMKSVNAKNKIEQMLNSPKDFIRNAAQKAIKKIDK